jgi:sec-independent protein translocase protein TatB
VLNNLGWEEVLLLAVIGLIVFGPERLPKAAADLGRLIRQLRNMARGAASDLRAELGPEMADVPLRSLHPKRFVQDAIFGNEPGAKPGGSAGSQSLVPPAPVALEANERPPYDPDAT